MVILEYKIDVSGDSVGEIVTVINFWKILGNLGIIV